MQHMLFTVLRPLPLFQRVLGDRSGATAIVIGLALTGMLGFAGLGTEAAMWYFTKRDMQSAADAAAVTAAANLAGTLQRGGSPISSQFTTDAQSVTAKYGFLDGTNGTTVSVEYPPNSGTYSGNSNYVAVSISQPQQALLSALFLSSGPTISARAVAKGNSQSSDSGCVYALSKQSDSIDVSASGSVAMNFSGCALYDNSPASGALTLSGSATIQASAAYISGGISGSGLTTTDGTYTGVNPVADPYANVAQPTCSTPSPSCLITCNGWTANGNNDLHLTNSNPSVTLRPSTAGGTCAIPQNIKMDSSGTTLNFCPGVYVFNGGSLLDNAGGGGATINAPPTATTTPPMSSTLCPGDTTGGVTLVFANGTNGFPGSIQINAQATINVTAPTSGATAGIAIFQARSTCPTNGSQACPGLLEGGATQNITGAIYFPNNPVSYAGGSSTGGAAQCTQLVANTITFTGGSNFKNNCQGTGVKTISYTQGWLAE